MIIAFNTKETEAIKVLMAETGLSEAAVMRQALRHYQLVHERMKAGETFSFSGDAARAREFAGLAETECIKCRGTGRYGGVYGPSGQPLCPECNGTGKSS